jgi:hypothetical protein
MESFPDSAGNARRGWLRATQSELPPSQSDFEKSAIWRGVFVAAFIVTVINIPVSPPRVQTHASVRATV